MAEKSWFFDNGELYGQAELRKYFSHIYKNGISVDDTGALELKVTASGSKVEIAKGFAIIGGFAYENDSAKELSITADVNYPRIDRVVIRLDLAAMKIQSALKKGVAASTPKPPDLQRDSIIYEISLAQARITTAGNIIITDERADQNVCGTIRPRNLTELDQMMKNFQKLFEEWFDAQQSKGWRNIYIQETTPGEAVSGSLWM